MKLYPVEKSGHTGRGVIKQILFIILVCFCISCCQSKPEQRKSLSPEATKSWIALGQLWGFLKYHHPAVAAGKYDWDQELIKRIPVIQKAENEAEWKKQLDAWLDSLPPVIVATKKVLPDAEIKIRPDYGILFDTAYFFPGTIDKIRYILENAVIPSNYYVAVKPLRITNEPVYEQFTYPELSYRLLALFRYWNIINYFFPYRELCDQKWFAVLEEMLPQFMAAATEEEYLSVCARLVTKTDDSHAFFHNHTLAWGRRTGYLKVPFETRFVEDKLVVTMFTGGELSLKDRIKIGDIITAINGEPVEEMVKQRLPYIPASNYAVKLRQIASEILRGNSASVILTIQRDSEYFDVKALRYPMNSLKIPNYYNPRPEEEGYQILENGIGYILPSSCQVKDRDRGIKKVLNGTKGLIIDMRCYPADGISVPLSEHLVHISKPHALNSYADIASPGYFFIKKHKVRPCRKGNLYQNKIVVIVNEYTQSQAEDHVLTYQLCPNATVIGSTTAGANGTVVNGIVFPGGGRTRTTGVGVYYPDGTDLQRVGVRIDEVVRQTIKGIKEGRDELLERAIEIIENEN